MSRENIKVLNYKSTIQSTLNCIVLNDLARIIQTYVYESNVDAYIVTYGVMYIEDQIMFLLDSKEDVMKHFQNQDTILKQKGFDLNYFRPNCCESWVSVRLVKNHRIVPLTEFCEYLNFQNCGTCVHCYECDTGNCRFDDFVDTHQSTMFKNMTGNLVRFVKALPDIRCKLSPFEKHTYFVEYYANASTHVTMHTDCSSPEHGSHCKYCEDEECDGLCVGIVFLDGVWTNNYC